MADDIFMDDEAMLEVEAAAKKAETARARADAVREKRKKGRDAASEPAPEADAEAKPKDNNKKKATGVHPECERCIDNSFRTLAAPTSWWWIAGTLVVGTLLMPLFERGKCLFVVNVLCDRSNPGGGMRWPGLGVKDYAWLFFHNVMNYIPVVNFVYALVLTYYYKDQSACLLTAAAPDAVA